VQSLHAGVQAKEELELLELLPPPPSSSSVLEKNTTTTTTPPVRPPEPPETPPEPTEPPKPGPLPLDPDLAMVTRVGNFLLDRPAAEGLLRECRKVRPDVTAAEIRSAMSSKCGLAVMKHVRNPIGFLLTAVPKTIASDWLDKLRADRAAAINDALKVTEEWSRIHKQWAAYELGEGVSPDTGRTKAQQQEIDRAYAARLKNGGA